MSKTKWHTKAFYLGIALVMTLSLLLVSAPPNAASADSGVPLRWNQVATPEVNGSDNVIRQDSDIKDFAVSSDGETIYAIGKVWFEGKDAQGNVVWTGYAPKLWKSSDAGASFSDKTKAIQVWDKDDAQWKPEADGLDLPFAEFSAVAVSPDDASFLAVAGMVGAMPVVVISDDGAAGFTSTGLESVAPGTEVSPRCLDISKEYSGKKAIAVGTTNPALIDGGGKVFLCEAGGIGISWKDTSDPKYVPSGAWISSIAVTSLAFSPAYVADKTLVVISNNGSDVSLQNLAWAAEKKWFKSCKNFDDVIGFSDIALPSDYMSGSALTRNSYVVLTGVVGPSDAITSDRGEVRSRIYIIRDRTANDVPPCRDLASDTLLSSIAYNGVSGEGKCMIGTFASNWDDVLGKPVPAVCYGGLQVYRTADLNMCCTAWDKSYKPPTGQLYTLLSYTSDGSKAYATTIGEGLADESAFSVSLNDGLTWNQISLIDTNVDYLSDVAVAPDCKTTYVASNNVATGCLADSVWRLQEEADAYAGVWQRVCCKTLGGNFGLLRLAVDETDGAYVVLGDMGTKNLYRTSNSGKIWSSKTASVNIQDIAVPTAKTIMIINEGACVIKSTDNGLSWEALGGKIDTKIGVGHTIAVMGDNVLVGPGDGGTRKVAYSSDGGTTFSRTEKLPSVASGNVNIAFHPEFADNSIIFAAVDNDTIYRWVIDESEEWRTINEKKAYGFYGIVLGKSDGTLYASYDGGVARAFQPLRKDIDIAKIKWSYLVKPDSADKNFTVDPSALRICGCMDATTNSVLYAIDNDDYDYDAGTGCVWYYEDCVAKAGPTVISPAKGAVIPSDPCECYNQAFTIKWEPMCNASVWDIYIFTGDGQAVVWSANNAAYTNPDYPIASPSAPSIVVPKNVLSCAQSYLWAVRVEGADTGEVIRSPWSKYMPLTVAQGPLAAIKLTAPDEGASNVPIENVGFTWTNVQDADNYEFMLSADADLSRPVELKTGLTGSAYTCTKTLENSTPYFWQVTAKKGSVVLSTSSASTFTTVAVPPAAPPPPPVPTTPSWVWVVIGIGAVLVIVVIVFIFRTRRV